MSNEHEAPRKIGLNSRIQRDIKAIMELRGQAMEEAGRPYTAQIIALLRGYGEGCGVDLDKNGYHIADDLSHMLIVERKSSEEQDAEKREEIRKAATKELN